MCTVSVKIDGASALIKCPYNDALVGHLRQLGGKWTGSEWRIDARDEGRARELLHTYYGTDGISAPDTVTLRVTWTADESQYGDSIKCHGRPIARAYGRDSGAKLGDNVAVLCGGFTSGGSVKHWCTWAPTGTVALLRDFPRKRAAELVEQQPDKKRTYAIEPETQPVDKAALMAERDRLSARIAEIDAALSA